MKNFNGIQTKFEMIGKYGCGLLCLLEAANIEEDKILSCYDILLKRNLIDKECFIKDWAGAMNALTGDKNWKAEIVAEKYENAIQVTTDDVWIEYWFNPNTGFRHFKLTNKDPLENSITVRTGHIESYRHLYK